MVLRPFHFYNNIKIKQNSKNRNKILTESHHFGKRKFDKIKNDQNVFLKKVNKYKELTNELYLTLYLNISTLLRFLKFNLKYMEGKLLMINRKIQLQFN